MVLVTNEQDFGPEIFLQAVLSFQNGEIIAGGNYTAVEDNEIVVRWGQNHLLRLKSAEDESASAAEAGNQEQKESNSGNNPHFCKIYGFYSTPAGFLGSDTFHFFR
jgi:hypothetical protein